MPKKNTQPWCIEQLDALFTPDTMSVHIVQWKTTVRKQWRPWFWDLNETGEVYDKKAIETMIASMEKYIEETEYTFKEITRQYSHVRQIGQYRIVIVSPPVAPVREITIVRPLVHRTIDQYKLPESVTDMLWKPWTGVLIAWAPGEWKTTFAQALLHSLDTSKYIVKTVEAPRDVQAEWHVTQYWLAHTTHNEIRDILLLTRPDITLFDEVRNKEDFHLYKDLRLAGIGLIWVMHATHAVDALQRSLGIIELWMLPQVINAVVYIKWWEINEVLTLKQVVKTPAWMKSDDLARPVLVIRSALKDKDVYEMYTYSDNLVVMPLDEELGGTQHKSPPVYRYAEQTLERQLNSLLNMRVVVKVLWPQTIELYAPPWETGRVIWRQWANIERLQEELGLSINVKTFEELYSNQQSVPHKTNVFKKWKKMVAELNLWEEHPFIDVALQIWGNNYSATTDWQWVITLRRKKLVDAIQAWAYSISL